MIVIPAYEPDQTLIVLVGELLEYMHNNDQILPLLIINDGSTTDVALQVFSILRDRGIEVITHDVNQGKGAALKTGIKIAQDREIPFIVTVDADGQHLPVDVFRVMKAGIETENSVILGRRVFNKNTPLRSKFGNELTVRLFRWTHGGHVNDTQTGLRYIPQIFYSDLLAISEQRYDFELAALILFVKKGACHEVIIQTIYEPGNPSSHFRKIQDSAKIYTILFRGMLVSLLLALVDFLTFHFVDLLTNSTTISVLVARTVGTVGYFYLARNFVYQAGNEFYISFTKYLALVLLNILILVPLIDIVEKYLELPKVFIYMLATLGLFLFNFYVQKAFIFKTKISKSHSAKRI
ncbi:glycosyltransferase family 2 protein [Yersinia ruckeri]|uniref:glycosyltransferase family 2 protein n=1 Tax=Yersinia ruckeri TaxID=29486 RepID=UPI002238D1D3|nr:glycosyltransferase family 2 protein [Yersinia ruckeri]MCW6593821.1 glycosyltransferase family 2 protein [Yersinia ruckeri]